MSPEQPATPNTGKPETGKPKAAATKYLVLAYYSGCWREVTTVAASSADTAIRAAADALEDADGNKFVAVPARSWKPRTITVETAPRVKLS